MKEKLMAHWAQVQTLWAKLKELWQDDKQAAGFGIRTVEDDEREASRLLVWVTAGTLLMGLLWAGFFSLDEITRGQGKIIPSSREQVIQSLDSGVLREMLVREGGNPADMEEGYYRILVRIKDANMVRKGMKLEPTPGMTASVEIRTGQKTVLEYLFRPLQNVSQALRER